MHIQFIMAVCHIWVTNSILHNCNQKIIVYWIRSFTSCMGTLRSFVQENKARATCTLTACFSKVPKTFRVPKATDKTPNRLFCEAGHFICCKGNINVNNCKVSCLETPLFWKYKENYVTRKTPEKFRDFRETGACRSEFFGLYFRYYVA